MSAVRVLIIAVLIATSLTYLSTTCIADDQEITANIETSIAVRIAPDGTPQFCSTVPVRWWIDGDTLVIVPEI